MVKLDFSCFIVSQEKCDCGQLVEKMNLEEHKVGILSVNVRFRTKSDRESSNFSSKWTRTLFQNCKHITVISAFSKN